VYKNFNSNQQDCDCLPAFFPTHVLRPVLESAELKWNGMKNDK